MKSHQQEVEIGGCGCCATYVKVEKVGDVLMPDGRVIHQYMDEEKQMYWVDPRLEATLWEED